MYVPPENVRIPLLFRLFRGYRNGTFGYSGLNTIYLHSLKSAGAKVVFNLTC